MGEYAVTGATSNPTIFAKARTRSGRYDQQLRAVAESGTTDPQDVFFELGLEDVRRAARILRPAHEASAWRGWLRLLRVHARPRRRQGGTIEQGLELWRRLDLPNVMIKVPATEAGVHAIEALTARGVNVNVTLLFSIERYDQGIEAYLRGLEGRVRSGEALSGLASMASFFVSRVDAKADAFLPADSPPRGADRDLEHAPCPRPLPRALPP